MKRQSKAEEALNRQIKLMDHRIDLLRTSRDALDQQIAGIAVIRDQTEDEVKRLRAAREKASANATR